MIAALALAGSGMPGEMDFDAFVKAIGACDRPAVTATIATEDQRHSQFLVDAFKEQRAIVIARVDLAERHRRLRAREATGDTDQAVTLAVETLDDRARALEDQRALDRSEQDMMGYFRAQYLRQCSGKAL